MCMDCYKRAVLAVQSGVFVFLSVDLDSEPDEYVEHDMSIMWMDLACAPRSTVNMLYAEHSGTRESAIVSLCEQLPRLFVTDPRTLRRSSSALSRVLDAIAAG